ncbi:MAG: hypothetical protein WAM14_01410 [Candidatus Nitrosopolaris sp.]
MHYPLNSIDDILPVIKKGNLLIAEIRPAEEHDFEFKALTLIREFRNL